MMPILIAYVLDLELDIISKIIFNLTLKREASASLFLCHTFCIYTNKKKYYIKYL